MPNQLIALPNELIAKLRIPTKEQYSYIEIEMGGTTDEIIYTYLEFTDRYKELLAKQEEILKEKTKELNKNNPPF